LVADRENGELYGISLRDPTWGSGIELVRMDARDGSILQSRVLESETRNAQGCIVYFLAEISARTSAAGTVRSGAKAKRQLSF